MNTFSKRSPSAPVTVNIKGAAHPHDSKSALRSRNLVLLMAEATITNVDLAEALEMPVHRVVELSDAAQPVSQEVAQHIEAMLELDTGWLDQKNSSPVNFSEKTKAILRGEAVSSMNVENVDETATPSAAAVKPENTTKLSSGNKPARRAVAPAVTSMALAAAKKTDLPSAKVISPSFQNKSSKSNQENFMTSKSTSTKRVTPETLQAHRRANFGLLTEIKGTKAKISRIMGCSAGHVTLLLSGGRQFLDETALNLETSLGLPAHWMDEKHVATDIPEASLMALFQERAIGIPTATSATPRRGRPSLAARQVKEAKENGGIIKTPKQTAKPSLLSPVAHQTEVSASAKPAQKLTAVAKPATEPKSYIRDVPAAPALTNSISPLVDVLLKTLAEKAQAGKLSDEQAYKMLGVASGF